MSQPLRIIFAGTPDFAAIHLNGIIELGKHRVIAVYCQPDRPAGRGKAIKPGPVKQLAADNGIPIYQPVNFKDAASRDQLHALNADLMVVVAYGLLLPAAVLQAPRLGCINVHASLLPRWRGAAPIQRAIEAGDDESGIVIMQMDEGLDTGDMLLEARCLLSADETAGSLHDKLAALGVPTLNRALDLIATRQIKATKQDDRNSCYAHKIGKGELAIDWRQPAIQLERKIRAFNPFPVAYTALDKQRVKIWRAQTGAQSGEPGTIIGADKKSIVVACGEGSLTLQQIQLPGGKVLDIPAVMNSKADQFRIGTRFDNIEPALD